MRMRCQKLVSIAAGAALVVAALPAAVHAQGSSPKAGGGQRTPARVVNLNECKPAYPKESTRAGETGTTQLRLRVSAEGKLLEAKVSRSSGFERLDNATLSALANCRYAPGTVDGVPSETATTVVYNWRLEDWPSLGLSECAKKIEYPVESLPAEEQGTTVLRVRFAASGDVERVEVEKSSGFPRLDEAAAKGFRDCRFKLAPTPPGQTPVLSTRIEYVWRLADEMPVPAVPLGPVAPDPYRPL
jgi:periplasmic protein TonB